MEIEDEFRVDVPIDDTWKVLLDIERIAPCLPGAQLQEVEGDEYRGIVKVKVGPITAQYKGAAKLAEVDETAHTVVLAGRGPRHARPGQRDGHDHRHAHARRRGHRRDVDTDLNVTGKVAQFGRGVLADVSTKLLGQFVENLERDVPEWRRVGERRADGRRGASEPSADHEPSPTAAARRPTASTGPRKIDSPEARARRPARQRGRRGGEAPRPDRHRARRAAHPPRAPAAPEAPQGRHEQLTARPGIHRSGGRGS